MSPAGKALWDALDHPEEWKIDRHTAEHTPSGTVWWTSNGSFFFDGYERTGPCLGLIERHFLAAKFKRMKSALVAMKLRASRPFSEAAK